MVAHVGFGLAIVALAFPLSEPTTRQRFVRRWSRRLLVVMRVELRVSGAEPSPVIADALAIGGCGAVLVLNHVSWLDIFVVHALRPAHFIAKAEIARWPLLGFLVDRTGAIFIERGKRHAVREVNHRIATMLADGELVGVFPEGTTGDGERLLPFHANLLQPAIDAAVPVVVAAIRYRDAAGGPTTATRYVGDTTLFQSLLRIARRGPLVAELQLIEAIDSRGASRHALVRAARVAIATFLDPDDEARELALDMSTVIVVPDVSPGAAPGDTSRRTMPDPRDELL